MIRWIIHWYQKFTFHSVFSFQKVFICKKFTKSNCALADNFGCLRFNAFDFQLKFNLKYTNFALTENYFFLMIYRVSALLGPNKKNFLASKFLIFVSNRFSMLHIFYKQLRLGNSTESCLWLWVNFHLKGCLALVV